MDRLETQQKGTAPSVPITFIFQYGQIRNIDDGEDKEGVGVNLYSSMDRLETNQVMQYCL